MFIGSLRVLVLFSFLGGSRVLAFFRCVSLLLATGNH